MVGKIFISGLIGNYENEKGVELVDVISQVRKQPDATSFNVYINSEGGLVDVGFDIYNYLKSLGLPITTIGNGLVASIATVIFMAGQKRLVTPNTQFMIHFPMAGISNATAEEMEMYSKELKSVENKIVDFYSKETSLQKEAITPLLRNETFLTESQLYNLGFVTQETPLKIAARAIINNQKSKKMAKKQNGVLDKIRALLGKDPIVNKIVFAADDREINFPDLGEEDEVVVGATATIDGATAEGEITAADGRIFVFEAGVLTEIKEPTTNEINEEIPADLVEVLTEILEIVEEVATEVEEVKEEVTAVKKDRDQYKARLEKAEGIIAKLKGATGKSPETEPKEKSKKIEGVSSVVAQWKSNKFKKN